MVKVTDSAAIPHVASQKLTLTIGAPEAALAIATPLCIGGVNTTYNATLQAEGGNAPYAWSLSSGFDPQGRDAERCGAFSPALPRILRPITSPRRYKIPAALRSTRAKVVHAWLLMPLSRSKSPPHL